MAHAPAPVPAPSPHPPAQAANPPPAITPAAGNHVVNEGENLWTIAASTLAARVGTPAAQLSDVEVARYWLQVLAANRPTLPDPNLIHPGQTISLP